MQDKTIKTELDRVLASSSAASSNAQVMSVVLAGSSATTGSTADTTAGGSNAQNSLAEAIAQSVSQLEQVRASVEGQLTSLTDNTRALSENTAAKSATSAVTGVATSLLSNVLGGGLLGPIVSGLMSLFGGGDDTSTTTTSTKYTAPTAVQFNAGLQNGLLTAADYGQNGQPRAVEPATAASQAQITVNVNAMDSRSFLDHSSEIASAVRRAMLESSSLNDVIGEM
jgi:hypothetical protein